MSSDLTAAVLARMRALVDGLQGVGGELLRAMLSHHLGWEAQAMGKPATQPAGKLVRPRLCLLSCEAAGGDPAVAVPAAAAVELIHNFSLIHDDVEDRDEVRRGRATVWKRWGEAQAVNAGDCMYSLAYAALAELDAEGVSPARRLRTLALMSEACIRLCEGQSHDLALQERPQVSQAEYLDMIGRKTAALMACAAETGAVLGGADDEAARALSQFGFDLGVAFQIRDDILGIWGDPQATGKPVGTDLSRRRCSYPVIVALERAQGADRDAILAAQGTAHSAGSGQASPERIAAAVSAIERLGARNKAEEMAAQAHARAWSALKPLRLHPRAERELRALAESLAVRQR